MSASPRPVRLLEWLPARVRIPLRRAWHSVVVLLPTAARLPAVSMDVGPWLPCWVLRLLAVGLGLGSTALVVRGSFGWTVAAVLCAVMFVRPSAPVAVILACVLGFTVLQAPEQPCGLAQSLLLLGLHACVALCLLIGVTSFTARVQLGVLVRPLPRFAAIQLIAQLLGAGGAALAGQQLSWPWIPVVAILGVVALAYLWLPALGLRAEPAARPSDRIPDAVARRWGDE